MKTQKPFQVHIQYFGFFYSCEQESRHLGYKMPDGFSSETQMPYCLCTTNATTTDGHIAPPRVQVTQRVSMAQYKPLGPIKLLTLVWFFSLTSPPGQRNYGKIFIVRRAAEKRIEQKGR